MSSIALVTSGSVCQLQTSASYPISTQFFFHPCHLTPLLPHIFSTHIFTFFQVFLWVPCFHNHQFYPRRSSSNVIKKIHIFPTLAFSTLLLYEKKLPLRKMKLVLSVFMKFYVSVAWAPACLFWARFNKHLSPFFQWMPVLNTCTLQWRTKTVRSAIAQRYKNNIKSGHQMLVNYFKVKLNLTL